MDSPLLTTIEMKPAAADSASLVCFFAPSALVCRQPEKMLQREKRNASLSPD
jgi:hypothetical protein